MAPLMALHRDRVEENPVPLFTKCRILFREWDSIVHLLDERDQLLARMSVVSRNLRQQKYNKMTISSIFIEILITAFCGQRNSKIYSLATLVERGQETPSTSNLGN
jgi:hypothetical protein